MKKLRKIVSLLLAVVMMMSLCVVQVGASGDGSITVNNTTSASADYSIYKMLDLTYNETNSAYSYYFDSSSDWYGFFTSDNVKNEYVELTEVGSVYYVTWKDTMSDDTSTVQAFAQLAMTYAEEKKVTATGKETSVASGSSATFSGLDLGYYLVSSTAGSLVALDSTAMSMTVDDKNAKPTITKGVADADNAAEDEYSVTSTTDLTETVYYKVTITGFDGLTELVLHDVLPAGFSNATIKSITLYSDKTTTNGITLNSVTDYVIIEKVDSCSKNIEGCSFEVNFSALLAGTTSEKNYYEYVLNANEPEKAYIEVLYTVTADSDAYSSVTINGTGNKNTAYLYIDGGDTRKADAVTYTYDFYVYKYAGTNTALSGAVFTFTNSDGKYAVVDSNGYLTGWSDTKKTLTTGEDGYIRIQGLDVGTYTLTETVAPSGYELPGSDYNPITVKIGEATNGTVTASYAGGNTVTITDRTVSVENSTSSAMPSTGGIGVTIFYVLGGVIVVAAVVLIVVLKRRTAKVDR